MTHQKLEQLKEYVMNNIILSVVVGGIIAAGVTAVLAKYGYLEIAAVVASIVVTIAVATQVFIIKNTKHMLIIEDSEELVSDLKIFFSKQGIVAKSVNNIEAAREAFKHDKFDFALIDLVLSGDAPQDIRKSVRYFVELRKTDIRPHILSGKSFDEVEKIFKEVFQPEIDRNINWDTLRHEIISCYFYKKDIQSLMRLVREIHRS